VSLRRWSRGLGVNYRTILERIKRGLSFPQAVEHPLTAPWPKTRCRGRGEAGSPTAAGGG